MTYNTKEQANSQRKIKPAVKGIGTRRKWNRVDKRLSAVSDSDVAIPYNIQANERKLAYKIILK